MALKYSDLYGMFSSFWTKFVTQTNSAHLNVVSNGSPFDIIQEGNIATVSICTPLHFKNWPYKASSNKKTLHILVQGYEEIDLKQAITVKSTVQVSYLQEKNMSLTPVEYIHYDYQAQPEQAHPVFHAQFSGEIVKTNIESLHDYKLLPDEMGKRFGYLKIPTAHMGLVSVLLGLCADHVPTKKSPASLKALIGYLEEIVEYPKAKAEDLTRKVSDSNSFCGRHWYTH